MTRLANAGVGDRQPPGTRNAGTLPGFFLLTFAWAWVAWLAAAAVLARAPSGSATWLRGFLFLPGTFAPALVAMALMARAGGRAALAPLVDRVLTAPAGARWYLFAITYMAAVKLAVALVSRLGFGAWPRFGATPWYVMVAALAISVWFQVGEELGWRGYALPRLTARLGLRRASLVLGAIWALWHLPLFLLPGTSTSGQSFPVFLLQVTALSVPVAWLYWKSGGSLLVVMLMHAALNNTSDIVPSVTPGAANPLSFGASRVAWLTVGLLWIGAACFLVRMRGVRTVPAIDAPPIHVRPGA
jgi:CAAX protease family protein